MIPDEARSEILALLQNDPDLKTPTAQPKPAAGRTQGGGKVAGQLSNTPGAVRKREQRAKKAAATSTTGNVQQKQLTSKGFSQMVGDLTKKAG
jgi:hypothetical protein